MCTHCWSSNKGLNWLTLYTCCVFSVDEARQWMDTLTSSGGTNLLAALKHVYTINNIHVVCVVIGSLWVWLPTSVLCHKCLNSAWLWHCGCNPEACRLSLIRDDQCIIQLERPWNVLEILAPFPPFRSSSSSCYCCSACTNACWTLTEGLYIDIHVVHIFSLFICLFVGYAGYQLWWNKIARSSAPSS